MAKLRRPIYARLKEMGEFFAFVLWPLMKERRMLWPTMKIFLYLALAFSVLWLIWHFDQAVTPGGTNS
jgi:hypothetical protein